MHGPDAVSEQSLLEQAIGRLPKGATVLGDANFGLFSVAYTGQQNGHPLLLRLTPDRAKCLAESLRNGIDRPLVWKPSRWDRKAHPSLPADACVTGRLIVKRVKPSNGDKPFLLALFTDLAEAVVALYGQRWNIETDLRTLKSTLLKGVIFWICNVLILINASVAHAAADAPRLSMGVSTEIDQATQEPAFRAVEPPRRSRVQFCGRRQIGVIRQRIRDRAKSANASQLRKTLAFFHSASHFRSQSYIIAP
jgi:hypothetical protein